MHTLSAKPRMFLVAHFSYNRFIAEPIMFEYRAHTKPTGREHAKME